MHRWITTRGNDICAQTFLGLIMKYLWIRLRRKPGLLAIVRQDDSVDEIGYC